MCPYRKGHLLKYLDLDLPDPVALGSRPGDGQVDGDGVVLGVGLLVKVGLHDQGLVPVKQEPLLQVDVGP